MDDLENKLSILVQLENKMGWIVEQLKEQSGCMYGFPALLKAEGIKAGFTAEEVQIMSDRTEEIFLALEGVYYDLCEIWQDVYKEMIEVRAQTFMEQPQSDEDDDFDGQLEW